jgi:hypothetical protein
MKGDKLSTNNQTAVSALDFKHEAEGRITEEYEKAGFVKKASNGLTVRDEEKFKARVYQVVSSKIATGKKDRSAKSVTNGELYAAVFPQGPGATPGTADQLDPIDAEARSLMMRRVWALTNPGPKGYIQRRLGDSSSLILCRGTVIRDLDETPGVYVTDDPTLIMEDSLTPQIDKLVRVANNLRIHAIMVTSRHPELEQRVTAALGSGVTRAEGAAQLPPPSTNGSVKTVPATPQK